MAYYILNNHQFGFEVFLESTDSSPSFKKSFVCKWNFNQWKIFCVFTFRKRYFNQIVDSDDRTRFGLFC